MVSVLYVHVFIFSTHAERERERQFIVIEKKMSYNYLRKVCDGDGDNCGKDGKLY